MKRTATLYVRGRTGLIVSSTTTSTAPDALDDLRVTVLRAFERALLVDEGLLTGTDPGMIDTTDLPPVGD